MIYLASSWRNPFYGDTLLDLRYAGFQVYDFKEASFRWADVATRLGLPVTVDGGGNVTTQVGARDMRRFLAEDSAVEHYERDKEALDTCSTLVLVLPCGRSAHTEFGMVSQDRIAAVYHPPGVCVEPELLYRQADLYTDSFSYLVSWLRQREPHHWGHRRAVTD